MALLTLRRMARGGIYDQLGGGFHRYSVDERWLVPHFEKMLYDNAQLVPLYLAAYQLTGDAFFATIARDTLDYVMREMRDPAGGFYSTQDADSEGEEGKFFVWDVAEVLQLLGEDVGELACRYWDVTETGNFEHRNILHVTLEIEQLAKLFRRDVDERPRAARRRARHAVRGARAAHQARPATSKVLTAWNGLMISAFAKAAEVFGDDALRGASPSTRCASSSASCSAATACSAPARTASPSSTATSTTMRSSPPRCSTSSRRCRTAATWNRARAR